MNRALVNLTKQKTIAEEIRYCNRFWSRMSGFLGARKPGPGDACWLIPCNMIHTFGMSYAIDAFFLNKQNEIVAIIRNLKPNRVSPMMGKAHSVIEFRAGAERTSVLGDKLTLGGLS